VTLAGDRQAAALGLAHQRHGARRRDVRHVVARPGPLHDLEIARDHRALGARGLALDPDPRRDRAFVHRAALGEIEILGVLHDREVERPGVLERAAQDAGIHHRPAVIGDRDDAALLHVADVGERLALEALGDRPDRPHPHGAELARASHDQLGHGPLIVDRLGVRHAADRREPPAAAARVPVSMSSLYS